MRYRIIYHVGTELTVRTKANSGSLTVQEDGLSITGASTLSIPFAEMVGVEKFRLHGLARMIKLVCKGRTVFFTVVRLNLFGYFIIVNFFEVGELYGLLKQKIEAAAAG